MNNLRLHASGRYFVRHNGKNVYLGRDKAEAERKYHHLALTGTPVRSSDPYISELLDQYPRHHDTTKSALRYLDGFGHYRVSQFGMTELRRLRESMLLPNERGNLLCRNHINAMMREVARFWKWTVQMEYAPLDVYQRCRTLEPLRKGQAPETESVTVVTPEQVEAVKALVSHEVSDLIDLQLLTGARSSELLDLHCEDINKSGEVWVSIIREHKTSHLGKSRTLHFGVQAQAILRPYLVRTQGYLFQYDKDSYRRAIARACVKAGIQHWHPHQLRHTAATNIRSRYGLESARAVLGHSNVSTTEIYAEQDANVARRIAAEIG